MGVRVRRGFAPSNPAQPMQVTLRGLKPTVDKERRKRREIKKSDWSLLVSVSVYVSVWSARCGVTPVD